MSCSMHFAVRWSLIGALWLFASTAAVTAPVLADDYAPQVGSPHVPFTLPTIDDGRPVSLEQFRGKKVLLIQFASW
ncbi:MAG: hypothetical protein Q8M16_18230 [Pirellulaceae bacterium]|nr:hypothetical protein [Pirellulaceae bacterium]